MSQHEEPLGARIARLRKQRGLSQREFAGPVERSETWLSQVERGARRIDRMSVLERLASALEVPLAELAPDQPVVSAASERPAPAAMLTLALSSSHALAAVLGGGRSRSPTDLSSEADQTWNLVHEARYQEASEVLAGLIPELELAARSSPDEEVRAATYATLAKAYHSTSAVLSKLGDPASSWVATDRAIAAAERSGDALLMAEGSFRLVLTFQSGRRFDQVLACASTAVDALRPLAEGGDPAARSLQGALHLQMAITKARQDRATEAYEHVNLARQLAAANGADRNDYGTEFGPTNVTLHEVSVAIELGDAGHALRTSATLDPAALSPERHARHLLDVARAHSQRRNVTAAADALRTAVELAPESMAGHPLARTVAADLRATGATTADLRSLIVLLEPK